MYILDFFHNNVIRDAEFCALGLSNSNPHCKFLTFCDSVKFVEEIINNKNINAVITNKELSIYFKKSTLGIVVTENPRIDFFKLHNYFFKENIYQIKHFETVIGQQCNISKLSLIDSHDVIIGDNVTIEPFVQIIGPCKIGDNSIIHTGCVIGGSGFEFKICDEVLDVAHCGKTIIGNDVIVWENTTIHKAVYPWDDTNVENHSRIGANVHIDHGSKIGKCTEVCSGAIVSGRCNIGNHVVIGPGAVISNRINVGDNAKVSLGSVVTKDVPINTRVTGNFAINHDVFIEDLKKRRG